jgi:hypothetical protein
VAKGECVGTLGCDEGGVAAEGLGTVVIDGERGG